ncbi:MAG TPA: hypothetical protein VFR37_09585 [Longimicrobium sp.]|nr:hypothetical protein [Longimicrobium sp.]
MFSNRLLRLFLLALLAALPACDDPSGGDDGLVPGEDLIFLRPAPNAPRLAYYQRSVLATKGDNAEIEIPYEALPGENEGEDCLRFRISGNSLLTRPDGRVMRDGDTITITIRVVDAGYFNFEFQPAGLRFSRSDPAELRVNYEFAHPDYNGDGEVDGDDDDFEFGWWRQEMPGQDWERIGSVRLHDLTEVRADITGFTRYALAGGN